MYKMKRQQPRLVKSVLLSYLNLSKMDSSPGHSTLEGSVLTLFQPNSNLRGQEDMLSQTNAQVAKAPEFLALMARSAPRDGQAASLGTSSQGWISLPVWALHSLRFGHGTAVDVWPEGVLMTKLCHNG